MPEDAADILPTSRSSWARPGSGMQPEPFRPRLTAPQGLLQKPECRREAAAARRPPEKEPGAPWVPQGPPARKSPAPPALHFGHRRRCRKGPGSGTGCRLRRRQYSFCPVASSGAISAPRGRGRCFAAALHWKMRPALTQKQGATIRSQRLYVQGFVVHDSPPDSGSLRRIGENFPGRFRQFFTAILTPKFQNSKGNFMKKGDTLCTKDTETG